MEAPAENSRPPSPRPVTPASVQITTTPPTTTPPTKTNDMPIPPLTPIQEQGQRAPLQHGSEAAKDGAGLKVDEDPPPLWFKIIGLILIAVIVMLLIWGILRFLRWCWQSVRGFFVSNSKVEKDD